LKFNMVSSNQLVNKLWNYCSVLRDDGLSYGDYVEQLTYLLFLKMDDERSSPPFNKESKISKEYNWESLVSLEGLDLEAHYLEILQKLGKQEGIIGTIFHKAQNKIQDPAKLRKLVIELINKENWLNLGEDLKGDVYEGLLEKNAQDVKSGAGQYFTPRPLINAMVEVMKPEFPMKIHDPASGTGGFLLSAYNYIRENQKLNRDEWEELNENFSGNDIVPMTARLCVMNLYLHGMEPEDSPIELKDSLKKNPGAVYDMILTNPPFGKKSSETIVTDSGEMGKQTLTYAREDFGAQTSNKQLNFLQHIKSILKINKKAAVVLPDNVLFEGGAGETIRKKLMHDCDLHTILRLPTGLFYAQGVKANVLFFDKKEKSEEAHTKAVWIYDLRTNKHFTLKTNPLNEDSLKDFVECYNADDRINRKESERFKKFDYEEILKRDKTNLDIFWVKDESLEDLDNLPEPSVLAGEIVESLENALGQIKEVEDDLK
jgi:type I restriction enzyme M protein